MKPALSALLLAAVLCATASAQQLTPAQVPAVVTQALRAKFPSVSKVEWKLKADKNYEAEFTEKGTDYAVKFDAAGQWLESEYSIPRSSVPRLVLDLVTTKFKGYKTTEIQRLQRRNDERPVYELHLENATEILKIQFGADAAILSQSSKPRQAKK